MDTIRDEDIAVIGMAGRFPGADSIDDFWCNTLSSKETLQTFSDDALIRGGVSPHVFQKENYVRTKGILNDVEYFDADFFRMSHLEAKVLDPQHRVLIQCVWEAFEDAAFVPQNSTCKVGVFASTGFSLYLLKNILSNQNIIQNVDEYQLLLGNDKDFLATRIAYLFDLKGPSLSIQTGCSSSLVAVHYACQSILNGECDLAIAGGVSITIPQEQGYEYKKDMIGSPDGRCYAFDARAQGTVKSNGAGVVLLKPLHDAVRDNDRIYAVISGTAINNDGANKVGYTAPSVEQQAAVIKEALQMADITPDKISYIETHGTGTLLGDPIEVAALKEAFATHKKHGMPCALTSLKSSIGHLDVAAGVSSLIRACLAVYHKKIPATLHYEQLNPKITLEGSPFYINTTLKDWPESDSFDRYAGVSAFGIGGTNVHAIIRQPPQRVCQAIGAPDAHQLLVFSAKSKQSLEKMIDKTIYYLHHHPEVSLVDAAFTLRYGRKVMTHRYAMWIRDRDQLLSQLDSVDLDRTVHNKSARPVVFAFSGQGAQYNGMARRLYSQDSSFRSVLDECFNALALHMTFDLKHLLIESSFFNEEATCLHQTEITQPALFAIEYALARWLLAKNVVPSALIGHSVGEYAAAVISGVFTLQDGARLIAKRGQLLQSLAPGSMLAVYEGEDRIRSLLPDGLDIALINAPNMTVISGQSDLIADFAETLHKQGIRYQKLNTSHAFHSRMLDSILDEFAKIVTDTERHPPKIQMISNVTGDWLHAKEACSVEYWVKQMRQTVYFSKGIITLQDKLSPIYIEIGPGRSLQGLLYKQGIQTVYNCLPQSDEETDDLETLYHTLASLWQHGVVLSLPSVGNRVSLPSYSWDRIRCWIDPDHHSVEEKKPSIETPEIASFDLESMIADIWQLVLGKSITAHDHFFHLGGTSLSGIAMIDKLSSVLPGENISIVHLYQYPKFTDFVAFALSLAARRGTAQPQMQPTNEEAILLQQMEL